MIIFARTYCTCVPLSCHKNGKWRNHLNFNADGCLFWGQSSVVFLLVSIFVAIMPYAPVSWISFSLVQLALILWICADMKFRYALDDITIPNCLHRIKHIRTNNKPEAFLSFHMTEKDNLPFHVKWSLAWASLFLSKIMLCKFTSLRKHIQKNVTLDVLNFTEKNEVKNLNVFAFIHLPTLRWHMQNVEIFPNRREWHTYFTLPITCPLMT